MADEEQDQTNPEQPDPSEQPKPEGEDAPSPEAGAEEALDAATSAVDDLTAEAADAEDSEQANDVLKAAMAAVAEATSDSSPAPASGAGGGATEFDLPSLDPQAATKADESLDLLSDVNLNVKVELGRTRMLVEDVLRLADGAVVELDKLAGDPVDIYVNDRPIARGEVLVLNDSFCVRVNEIISNDVIKRERAS